MSWTSLTCRERIVLLGLLNHANGVLQCWPGRELIASECGMSESAYYRVLAKLRDDGWINLTARKQASTVISLLPFVARMAGSDDDIPIYAREVFLALLTRDKCRSMVGDDSHQRESKHAHNSHQRESKHTNDSHQRAATIPTSELHKDVPTSNEVGTTKWKDIDQTIDSQLEPPKVLTLSGEAFEPPADTEMLVFDRWRTVMNHPRAKLDQKRRTLIRKWLRELAKDPVQPGVSADVQMFSAICGCANSPWHMGISDNSDGTRYDDLSTIFRNRERVEKFITMADRPPVPRRAVRRAEANAAAVRRGIELIREREGNT